MILRRFISLTILVSLLPLLHCEDVLLASQSTISDTPRQRTVSSIVIAKKTTPLPRVSASLMVNNVRYHDHKQYTRVVLDLSGQSIIQESKNARTNQATLVLAKARLGPRAIRSIQRNTFPKAMTISENTTHTVTVILDLMALDKYTFQTLRRPNRLVVDLFYSKKKTGPASHKAFSPPAKKKKNLSATPQQSLKAQSSAKTKPLSSASRASVVRHVKDLVIVIDPGHGGKDPGAIGKKGTQEKHLTLKIGTYLKNLIQKRLGSKVFLTRSKDRFLDLEKRVIFANKKKADIFISIHVNSHPQKTIHGLEIYHFGKASDPRALEVAARENGMKLEGDAPPWQFIIADKLNDQKIEQSQTLAWTTNATLVKFFKASSYTIYDHGVKTAPFYVLRFTTMPSILAEVAFVSNPKEEDRLRSTQFQKQLAEGIYQGMHSYLKTVFPTLS